MDWIGRIFAGVVLLGCAAAAQAAEIRDGYFRTSDGIQLHYRESGTGPKTLIFIPGWLMPAEIFDAQLRALGDSLHVYALSPRSQGRSDLYVGRHTAALRARDIHEFVVHANVPDPVLVGWSLGVMEALDYVHRYRPASLRALVLIDNSIGAGRPPRPRPHPQGRGDVETPEMRVAHLTEFVKSMFKTPQAPEFIDIILQSALRPPRSVAQELLAKPYPREYYKDVIYQENIPVWYAITPRFREQGDELMAHLGKARVTVYPNAGHALFVDAAPQFNADLQRFLETVY